MTPSPTRITVLGCGSSGGVPLITGHWGLCDPKNPKNARTRCSVAVDMEGQTWLIDVSPDVRGQLLRQGITSVQGVLCTHAHFDHMGGMPDLKPFAFGRCPLPVYSDAVTLKKLLATYPYAFTPGQHQGYAPFLEGHLMPCPLSIGSTPVQSFVQDHGYGETLGFRFPRWAYSTDVCRLPEEAFSLLEDLDLWLVDCLDILPRPMATHSFLEQTLGWIQRVKPKKAVLIHMGNQVDYATLEAMLPPQVTAAYDGLVLEV